MDYNLPGPLSIRFSRQEYWSGLSCTPPGDLPDPVIKLRFLISPAFAGRVFTPSTTLEACYNLCFWVIGHLVIFFFFPEIKYLPFPMIQVLEKILLWKKVGWGQLLGYPPEIISNMFLQVRKKWILNSSDIFPFVLSILPHFSVGRPNGSGFIPWINDSSNQFNLEPNKFS